MNHRITLLVASIAVLAGCHQPRQEPATAESEHPSTLDTPVLAEGESLANQAVPSVPPTHREVALPRSRHAFAQQDLDVRPHGSMPGKTGTEPWRSAQDPIYRERYERPDDHGVVRVSERPVSTFSIDVDTGSYTNTRRWLNQGQLPPGDAVRIEEFINYFDYSYEAPDQRHQPFAVHIEAAPTPWNPNSHLVRIGLKGYEVPRHALPPANLVFLLDVSGSMNSADKLPLLKQALRMLNRSLDAEDRVSIVVYAGASGVVLPPTAGNDQAAIVGALERLSAGGSTNGAAGIETAYRLARQHYREGGINRVILATDGDFNVGLASHNELLDLVTRQRDAGIALTTLGFGTGNYNDHLLEQLADVGNGNHAYIDQLSEARKVLEQELGATLLTIAGDVKLQVEFNPATVSGYRLIGYENRALDEAEFDNDRVDAGDIGAGHRVTALYEVNLVGTDPARLPSRRYAIPARVATQEHLDELAQLRIRYKLPGQAQSIRISQEIRKRDILQRHETSHDFRFAAAVAAFGQHLRGGEWLADWTLDDIETLAGDARGADDWGYRSEFLQLVRLARSLEPVPHPNTETPPRVGHIDTRH